MKVVGKDKYMGKFKMLYFIINLLNYIVAKNSSIICRGFQWLYIIYMAAMIKYIEDNIKRNEFRMKFSTFYMNSKI